MKIKIRINGHLHKEEEDGKIGGDRHSDVELHCLHLNGDDGVRLHLTKQGT